ncbi:hypothetical protein C4571_00400 [Candidatus Parcubacteria bacterium]|nr:MAG: hypothetical protein C4571_00400 [Candidatus Parcubacteria bacterium]
MRRFLKKHHDLVLTSVALFFLIALLGVFVWGGKMLLAHIERAINGGRGEGSVTQFNLEGARALHLKAALEN